MQRRSQGSGRRLWIVRSLILTWAISFLVLSVIANATTLTIISGNGAIGDRDPINQFSLDGVNFQDAFIIAPSSNWSTIAGTQWINCGPSDSEPCGLNTTVRYRTTFQLPNNFVNPSLTVTIHADNAATIFLNGTQIGQQPQGDFPANFQDPPETFTTSDPSLFVAGTNVLEFDVIDFGFSQGLDYKATVSFNVAPITVAPGAVVIDDTDGICSLREAIENANDTTTGQPHPDCAAGDPAGADTLELAANSTYTLTDGPFAVDGATGLPSITSEITINGNGATVERDPTLSCNLNGTIEPGEFRIFHVAGTGNLTLNSITVRNGCADGGNPSARGAGIRNLGALTVQNSTIADNSCNYLGCGIDSFAGSTLTVQNSTISGNAGRRHVGIAADGMSTIESSTITSFSREERRGTLAFNDERRREVPRPCRSWNDSRLTSHPMSGSTSCQCCWA